MVSPTGISRADTDVDPIAKAIAVILIKGILLLFHIMIPQFVDLIIFVVYSIINLAIVSEFMLNIL